MNREYDMVKLAQWAQIIQSANESKLGRKEWCAENGITESSFYYWQRRVRKYALSKMLDQREHNQLPSPDQEPRSEEKGFYEKGEFMTAEKQRERFVRYKDGAKLYHMRFKE